MEDMNRVYAVARKLLAMKDIEVLKDQAGESCIDFFIRDEDGDVKAVVVFLSEGDEFVEEKIDFPSFEKDWVEFLVDSGLKDMSCRMNTINIRVIESKNGDKNAFVRYIVNKDIKE